MAEGESHKERVDRELMELLQELRVVLPGVQVLLAFLLTAPFQQQFAQLPATLRNSFFASIVCATLATFLLIAPSAHHRLRFRAGEKERLLHIGNKTTIVGTAFLGAAIVLALYVVTSVLFTTELALVTAGVAAVVFVGIWYALPLLGSSSSEQGSGEEESDSPDGEVPVQESRGASSRR
jgi:hypothetical protein